MRRSQLAAPILLKRSGTFDTPFAVAVNKYANPQFDLQYAVG